MSAGWLGRHQKGAGVFKSRLSLLLQGGGGPPGPRGVVGPEGQEGTSGVDGVLGKDGSKGMPVRQSKKDAWIVG